MFGDTILPTRENSASGNLRVRPVVTTWSSAPRGRVRPFVFTLVALSCSLRKRRRHRAARPGDSRGRGGGDHPRFLSALIRDLVADFRSCSSSYPPAEAHAPGTRCLRGLPTVPGPAPRGPCCLRHDDEGRESADALYLLGAHRNVHRKPRPQAKFFVTLKPRSAIRGRSLAARSFASLPPSRRKSNSARTDRFPLR